MHHRRDDGATARAAVCHTKWRCMRCGGGNRLWGLQANSHDLRASNSLHGVLGLKLAGDGAVRGRLGAIQAAEPTVFRCDTQVMLCSGFDHQSPKRRVSSPK